MFQYLWQLYVGTVGFSQLDTESLQDQTNIPALSSEANKVHQYLHGSEPMRRKKKLNCSINDTLMADLSYFVCAWLYIICICKLEFQQSASANLNTTNQNTLLAPRDPALPASHPGSQVGASCATAAMVVLFPQPGGPSRRMGLVFDCSSAFFTSARKACLKVQPFPLRDGGKSLACVEIQLRTTFTLLNCLSSTLR